VRYGVIGSGPCGAFAALRLLQSGFDVDLIEIDNRESVQKSDLQTELKLNNGESSSYDMNQILKIEIDGHPATFYRSKVLGGFSGVWGATWDSNIPGEDPSWTEHYAIATRYMRSSLNSVPSNSKVASEIDSVCDCLSFIKNTSSFLMGEIKETNLAIAYGKCSCLAIGKGFCNHGSIWSSLSLIEECKKFEKFRLISGVDVNSLSIADHIKFVSGDEASANYDSIILGAGPLGISEILLNSFEKIQSIHLSETRMGYAPYFKYKLKSRHRGAFAFSKYRFDLMNSQQEVSAHVQLYVHSELYLDRIKGKIPKPLKGLSSIALKVLTPHMGIALFYISSAMSESLEVSINPSSRQLDIKTRKAKNRRYSVMREIKLKISGLGLKQFLPSFLMAKVGESYHLGAAENLLDEFGFLKIDRRISVAGSFALPQIIPGPITHAAMAQTSRLVEKIIHQNLERI
jgi:hypothetical protein